MKLLEGGAEKDSRSAGFSGPFAPRAAGRIGFAELSSGFGIQGVFEFLCDVDEAFSEPLVGGVVVVSGMPQQAQRIGFEGQGWPIF